MTKEIDKDLRDKALEHFFKEVNKEYGVGAVMYANSKPLQRDRFSSGSLSIDRIAGGGLPNGSIMEIWGPFSSGKTTVALTAVAEMQKLGGVCGYIDVEHALDMERMLTLGVNLDDLILSQPNSAEQALNILITMCRTGAIDLVVVDSVAALVPMKETESEIGDSSMGVNARYMSKVCRILTPILPKSNTSIIFINQIREKIGVMFGSPETTTGGRALAYYSDIRFDIRKIAEIKNGDEVIGIKSKVTAKKNKTAAPYKSCEISIMFDKGIDTDQDLFDIAVNSGIISKTGAWFTIPHSPDKVQGINGVKEFYLEHPEDKLDLLERVRETFK